MANSVLHPRLLHLGRRHYRINDHAAEPVAPIGQLDERCLEADDSADIGDESAYELGCTISADERGFVVDLRIPYSFHRHILGFRRTTLTQIQTEFSCRVLVPPVEAHSPKISIMGASRSGVIGAVRRIQWVYRNARSRSKPTHFLCLPANLDEIKLNYEAFRCKVLDRIKDKDDSDFAGVHIRLFQSPETMHFTIVPLLLADDEEINRALNLLKEYTESSEGQQALSAGPFRLSIRGLEYMNDDPNAVRVLYAKIAPSPERDRFQQVSNSLAKLFEDHDLTCGKIERPKGDVLLHLTVLNAAFATESTESDGQFSVVGILREFGDFTFANDKLFDCIHLSTRGSYSETGFYTECGRISLADSCVAVLDSRNTKT